MESRPPLRIPLRAVLVDMAGALLCGYGVYGFIEPAGAGAPPVILALACTIAGAVLMGWAMLTLLRRIREQVRAFPRE